MVDVDGGARSVLTSGDVDIVNPFEDPEVGSAVDLFAYFKQLCTWLHEQDEIAASYRTVAIDTLSELHDHLMTQHLSKKRKEGHTPDWKDYNEIKNQLVHISRSLRTLSQRRGVNIIFTTHLIVDSAESMPPIKKRPSLSPAARRHVLASLDMVGMIEVNEKTRTRTLTLQELANTETKKREPFNWPRKLPGVIENPNMVDILEYIHGDGDLKGFDTPPEGESTPT